MRTLRDKGEDQRPDIDWDHHVDGAAGPVASSISFGRLAAAAALPVLL